LIISSLDIEKKKKNTHPPKKKIYIKKED